MCLGGVLSSLSGLLERVEGHQPLLLLLFLKIFYGVTQIARVKLGMELKQHLREGETEIVLVWSRVFVIV